jgi:hypothetical protein
MMTFFESDRQVFCSTAVLKGFHLTVRYHCTSELLMLTKLLGDNAACLEDH